MVAVMVLLDTHVLLWWAYHRELLSREASTAIDGAEALGVPAIVFWEIALLVRKGSVSLGQEMTAEQWCSEVLSIPRVRDLPLTSEIAVQADGLEMHSDPADRFIVATAVTYKAPLVTRDALLRSLETVKTIW